MRRVRSAVGVGLAMLLAACAVNSEPGGPPAGPSEETSVETPLMPTLETMTESVLDDAAKRTGLERSRLVVKSAEAVTWADGSLGCPQPGMNYTMALVPGYRIRIRAGDQLLDYHASRSGYYVLRPAGQASDPLDGAAIR
jgi:hypothetical protein